MSLDRSQYSGIKTANLKRCRPLPRRDSQWPARRRWFSWREVHRDYGPVAETAPRSAGPRSITNQPPPAWATCRGRRGWT